MPMKNYQVTQETNAEKSCVCSMGNLHITPSTKEKREREGRGVLWGFPLAYLKTPITALVHSICC